MTYLRTPLAIPQDWMHLSYDFAFAHDCIPFWVGLQVLIFDTLTRFTCSVHVSRSSLPHFNFSLVSKPIQAASCSRDKKIRPVHRRSVDTRPADWRDRDRSPIAPLVFGSSRLLCESRHRRWEDHGKWTFFSISDRDRFSHVCLGCLTSFIATLISMECFKAYSLNFYEWNLIRKVEWQPSHFKLNGFSLTYSDFFRSESSNKHFKYTNEVY